MSFKIYKISGIAIFCIALMVVVPTCFAEDSAIINSTDGSVSSYSGGGIAIDNSRNVNNMAIDMGVIVNSIDDLNVAKSELATNGKNTQKEEVSSYSSADSSVANDSVSVYSNNGANNKTNTGINGEALPKNYGNDSNLTINSSFRNYNEFNVTLTDDEGNKLFNKTVYLNLTRYEYSKVYTLVTNENGVATLALHLNGGSVYTIFYSFVGDELYNPSEGNSSFRISIIGQLSNHLEANDFVESYADGKYFVVNLRDPYGNRGPNYSISLTLINQYNQNKTYNLTTDSNGTVRLQINLLPGTYKIQSFYENTFLNYYNSSLMNTIVVNKANAVLSAVDTVINGSSKFFKVNLIDNDGKVLANQTVNMKLINSLGNSKVYKVLTDNEGVASLPIHLIAGNYSMECSLDSSLYSANSTLNNMAVNIQDLIVNLNTSYPLDNIKLN